MTASALAIALLCTVTTPVRADQGWRADLSTVDEDDVNVAFTGALTLRDPAWRRADQPESEGTLLLPWHPLARPANRISAKTVATGAVDVDVRGHGTEWTAAGTPLPEEVTEVQVRISLRTSAAVSSVRLTADSVPAPRSERGNAAASYRVFATREGLVGNKTANGHVIAARDHFVAFPSRRGLSPKGSGDYTVRVCSTDRSRCEYAPVWDVGPWNVRDDYWNPAAQRQSWQDLAQGMPQAQAAYQLGYNGGKDQYGRKVANPAGIDLADGTFWDGLKLSTNAWVDVTYLWTGSGTTADVRTEGGPLNLRSGPGTGNPIVGFAANYARVTAECTVAGQYVTGAVGASAQWARIGPGHYVSRGYLLLDGEPPAC
ncbi:hypothetical protein [Amycolatopsis sp. CA-230715]|uniref:hypothetical protein n=1 Tax=Amycolatopsis sp. CA-230715 TaxID=2745196 RepID=UPI0020B37478|nr:hypothetical protein [Amycolatopsis sp. CA-230715]